MNRFEKYSFACLMGCCFVVMVGVFVLALWPREAPRATVITPTAIYENAEVRHLPSRYEPSFRIVTDDGKTLTITGSCTVVWNSAGGCK
jgi:hypothetical protein